MKRQILFILSLVAMVSTAACSAERPVLYPNNHLSQVGDTHAQTDIDLCLEHGKQAGVNDKGAADAAKSVGGTAAVGAATGAAVGAVGGNAGRGASRGAAGGAAAGAMRYLFRSNKPDGVYKTYVDRCLRQKGYDVAGWR